MADRAISALAAITNLTGDAQIELETAAGNSRQGTILQLSDYLQGSMARGGWSVGTFKKDPVAFAGGWGFEMDQTFSLAAGQRLILRLNAVQARIGPSAGVYVSKDAGTTYYGTAMQGGDGNLVLYKQGAALQASGTSTPRTGRMGSEVLFDLAVHAASSNRMAYAVHDAFGSFVSDATNDMTGGTLKVYVAGARSDKFALRYRLLG